MNKAEADMERRVSDIEARCDLIPGQILERLGRLETKQDAHTDALTTFIRQIRMNGKPKTPKWIIGVMVGLVGINVSMLGVFASIVMR